ncbi:MAG TPA: DUF6328 family protein [Burkholderiales bacterium]|jgi:hypothetical protein
MSIEKPVGAGKKEEVKLDSAASHLLEECRMVLPGIQALFGFQLIAVFNDGFEHKLAPSERQLHFLALFLVAVSAAFVMAPAAIHRQSQQREVSERFIWLSSLLLRISMLPLALGLTLDVYLIAVVVFGTSGLALAFAAALLVVLLLLWVVLPRLEGRSSR